MSDKIKKPTVIALGYFDSVHVGHKKVIESAKAYANKHGLSLTIFTFKGNLKEKLGYPQEKCVYLPEEREKFFMQLGADEVYFAPVSRSFLGMGKLAFLNYINRRYQIKCYFTGTDYRFGSKGKGNVEYLNRYAKNHGQDYVVIDTLNILGKKCSTTAVKEALNLGDIKHANTLLGRNYSVSGVVRHDRHVGTKIGFPTVNIAINRDKFSLKNGVYSGKIDIDGKSYKTVINYGARPTFDLGERLIEAHIVGFSGDLYGKKLTVEFTDFIREIKKFNGKEELIEQLKKDVQGVKVEKTIKFGPSGNSIAFGQAGYSKSEESALWVKNMGLTCFEYSFGRGVSLSDERAISIGQAFKDAGVEISVHAPYYINFANPENENAVKSNAYVIQSAQKVKLMGGNRVIFHPASQGKMKREDAVKLTVERLKSLRDEIYEKGLSDLIFCPETMGKLGQIGTIEEIVEFCKIDKIYIPCVDFGHINAREFGSLKTESDYEQRLSYMIDQLGYDKMKHFHIHFSKIEYSAKGEVRHLTFEDDHYGPDFTPLAKVLKKLSLFPVVVCESAGTQDIDALKMQNTYLDN